MRRALCLLCAFVWAVAAASGGLAAPLKSADIVEAVGAITRQNPSPAQKKAVDQVLAAMRAEHLKSLKLSDKQVTPQLAQQINKVSRLALMAVATMTADDPKTLRQFTLEDLMSVAGVVMAKLREQKVSEEQLKDQKFLTDSFIPQVIEALAK